MLVIILRSVNLKIKLKLLLLKPNQIQYKRRLLSVEAESRPMCFVGLQYGCVEQRTV